MRYFTFILALSFFHVNHACTSMGVKTDSGTIIGQNLDYYYYLPQTFERMLPIQQFNNWYDNNYGHNNEFYALVSGNNIQMGVNQNGLTVLEEQAPNPVDYKKHRRFQQPENGNAEGMIKYGILQNFNTVDEIIPFLSKIFSVAQPDFYQIADANKLLTVEVGYGNSNADSKRKFSYRIISQKNAPMAHTNFYLSRQFASLNGFRDDPNYFIGARNRQNKIMQLMSQSKDWFMNTSSNVSSNTDPNGCRNTSLFRSNLHELNDVTVGAIDNRNLFGTVSTMIVNNTGKREDSRIYVMMVDSVTADKQNQQVIKYRTLHTTLATLFDKSKPIFVPHEWVRTAPIHGVCN